MAVQEEERATHFVQNQGKSNESATFLWRKWISTENWARKVYVTATRIRGRLTSTKLVARDAGTVLSSLTITCTELTILDKAIVLSYVWGTPSDIHPLIMVCVCRDVLPLIQKADCGLALPRDHLVRIVTQREAEWNLLSSCDTA